MGDQYANGFKIHMLFKQCNTNTHCAHGKYCFSQTLALRDCTWARVWSDYYSRFVIPSQGLKLRNCFSLTDRKKQYKIGKKVLLKQL